MKRIQTSQAPQAIGPYSQAIVVGNTVYCSGQIAIDPTTGEVIRGDVEAQTHLALKNLAAVLRAAGSSLNHVAKTTVFLKDMDDFPRVNAVYAEHFGTHRPARACVAVATLPKRVDVEIDAVAIVADQA